MENVEFTSRKLSEMEAEARRVPEEQLKKRKPSVHDILEGKTKWYNNDSEKQLKENARHLADAKVFREQG